MKCLQLRIMYMKSVPVRFSLLLNNKSIDHLTYPVSVFAKNSVIFNTNYFISKRNKQPK
jgi:hypothetical protein